MQNPPIPPLQPGVTQPTGKEVRNLRKQLKPKPVTLPRIPKWENPNRVVVQGRSVPGWKHEHIR